MEFPHAIRVLISPAGHPVFIGLFRMGGVQTTTTMTEEKKNDVWKVRVLPALSYLVAIGLTLTSPALIAGSLVLAVLAGDAAVAGLGILAGALLGATGALALLWCLATTSRREQQV